MSLDEIVLTSDELSALKYLDKNAIVVVEKINRAVLERLEHFGLVEIYAILDPTARELARQKSKSLLPQAAKITDKGKDYLAYHRAKKHGEARSAWRDFLFLLAGAALTFLFDHATIIAALLKRFF